MKEDKKAKPGGHVEPLVRPNLSPLEFAVFNAFADWRDEVLTNQEIADLVAAFEGRGVYLVLRSTDWREPMKEYDVYESDDDLYSSGVRRKFGENKIITLIPPFNNEGNTLFASVLPLLGEVDENYRKIGTIKSA